MNNIGSVSDSNQPSLMKTVDAVSNRITQWKYIRDKGDWIIKKREHSLRILHRSSSKIKCTVDWLSIPGENKTFSSFSPFAVSGFYSATCMVLLPNTFSGNQLAKPRFFFYHDEISLVKDIGNRAVLAINQYTLANQCYLESRNWNGLS